MIEQELSGALIIAVLFGALLAATELWTRRSAPHPETSRKIVHTGGGLICVALPYLVSSWVTVLALGVSMSILLFAGKRLKLLRSLYSVQRKSSGSEYFPLAVLLTFLIAHDRPGVYVSAILVLAVADAGAALVGSHLGTRRYYVDDTQKSVEGSLAFFVLAFLAVYLPLVFLGEIPAGYAFFCSLLVGVLLTGVEAVSLGGRDNIFVPLGTSVFITKITAQTYPEVLYQNAAFALLAFLGAVLIPWVKVFTTGGAVTVVLFSYAAFSLGSEEWVLPVLMRMVLAELGRRELAARGGELPCVNVSLVSQGLMIPFLLLVTANLFGVYSEFFGPFMLALAASYFSGPQSFRKPCMITDPATWYTPLSVLLVLSAPPFVAQAHSTNPAAMLILLLAGIAAAAMQKLPIWQWAHLKTRSCVSARNIYVATCAAGLLALQYLGAPKWEPSSLYGVCYMFGVCR